MSVRYEKRYCSRACKLLLSNLVPFSLESRPRVVNLGLKSRFSKDFFFVFFSSNLFFVCFIFGAKAPRFQRTVVGFQKVSFLVFSFYFFSFLSRVSRVLFE